MPGRFRDQPLDFLVQNIRPFTTPVWHVFSSLFQWKFYRLFPFFKHSFDDKQLKALLVRAVPSGEITEEFTCPSALFLFLETSPHVP